MPPIESPENNTQVDSIADTVSRILAEGSFALLATLIQVPANAPAKVGGKLLIDYSGTTVGGLGNEDLDYAVLRYAAIFFHSRAVTRILLLKDFAPELAHLSEAQILFERIEPEPRLVICGAGHVGASLAKLAGLLGYSVTLIDDRAEFVSREAFPEDRIELVAAKNWADAVRAAMGNGRGVGVAIVTRGHSEDEQCLRAVLNVDPVYVGLIGSKRRTNIVLERLRENGVSEEKLAKVRAPVGLDIGAVTPEEVALAIMAEIVAERRGGKGGSLSEWRRESEGKGEGVKANPTP